MSFLPVVKFVTRFGVRVFPDHFGGEFYSQWLLKKCYITDSHRMQSPGMWAMPLSLLSAWCMFQLHKTSTHVNVTSLFQAQLTLFPNHHSEVPARELL